MCSLILFSLYSNDLLKYKNCVIKTRKILTLKMSFMKEKFICKEKSRTDSKLKLVTKLRNIIRFILELWY